MKKILANVMASTGITLVILSFIGTFFGAKVLLISSVFESLGANILINLGFVLIRKFEIKYFALEISIDIFYSIAVVIIFGSVFDWFAKGTPAWMLASMALIIYLLGLMISVFCVREDVKAINKLLQKRNEKF